MIRKLPGKTKVQKMIKKKVSNRSSFGRNALSSINDTLD